MVNDDSDGAGVLGIRDFDLELAAAALDAWQRAVDLQRDLWDALWNLGTQAQKAGRTAQARKALERFVAGAPSRYSADVKKAQALLAQMKP